MSGYLDVKFPCKSNRGLNPFRVWKKQWCILRPSPIEENGGSIALHSSFGLAANSTIDLPSGCTICRAQSKTHAFAFGVFLAGDYLKPHVLLAGPTEVESQIWMSKIRAVLHGKKYFGRDILLKSSYPVTILETEFSRKCELHGVEGTLTISPHGFVISHSMDTSESFVAWKHIADIRLHGNYNDKHKICVVTTNSVFSFGIGEIRILCLMATNLVHALKDGQTDSIVILKSINKRLSRSDGDLPNISIPAKNDDVSVEGRRGSWNSKPVEVSLDDSALVTAKDVGILPLGPLVRCFAEDDLQPPAAPAIFNYAAKFSNILNDSMSDRRSLISIASGIYEEIPEVEGLQSSSKRDIVTAQTHLVENTYESVAESIYATMRRTGKKFPPPPLPPRLHGVPKLSRGWSAKDEQAEDVVDGNVTRHNSLSSLPRTCSVSSNGSSKSDTFQTLPKNKPTFNVFRKRIKSESRVFVTEKTDKKCDTKKKKIDSTTPSKSRDLFKNFRVSKTLKNFKISSTNLSKIGETKSCEFLDETEHVTTNRCSKSVECLETGLLEGPADTSLCSFTDDGEDLSLLSSEKAVESLSLPPDIVELILRGRDDLAELRLRHMEAEENAYMPMSPSMPVEPIEHHYTVMHSPATRPPCPTTNVA